MLFFNEIETLFLQLNRMSQMIVDLYLPILYVELFPRKLQNA